MENWKKIDQDHVWHPFSSLESNRKNLLVESASGATIKLQNGETLIDAVASWWVNLHGHANHEVAEVLAEQATTLEHVIFAGFTHKPALQITEQLLQNFEGSFKRLFFSDDGSTAVEVGVKLGLQYWHNKGVTTRKKIITLEGAYHGDTFGSMSLAGKSAFFAPFNDLLFDVIQIPFPHEGQENQTIEAFKKAMDRDDVAAFVYEPLVQGSAGMRIYEASLLEQLLTLAKKNEIICIADEVMTGFYRTGRLLASDYMNAKPDIVAVSKGITAGFLPLGVTVCNEKIEQAFIGTDQEKTFYHGHSYTGNPLSCAVAVKSLEILLRKETQDKIKNISKMHQNALKELKEVTCVKKVKTLGTILSLEIETGESTSYFSSIRDFLYESFLKKGVLLRPLGNVVYILPPYVITEKQLTQVYQTIKEVLSSLK